MIKSIEFFTSHKDHGNYRVLGRRDSSVGTCSSPTVACWWNFQTSGKMYKVKEDVNSMQSATGCMENEGN